MSDSVTGVTTTDAELARLIRDGHERDRSPAAAELTHRHIAAVRAYAGLLCADERAAEELADESFERTLEAVRTGTGPTAGWRPYLLAEVRRTAAGRADTGRGAALSTGFASWLETLPQPDPAAPSARDAATAAEADAFLLRGFLGLSEHQQAALWDCLGDPADQSTTPRPVPEAPARQILYEAYLQAYAARVPDRSCRHLTAALGEFVRDGAADDTEKLGGHLSRCDGCGRARAELTAIDLWQRPVLLRGLLLWAGEPSSTALPVAAAGTLPAPAAAPRPATRTRARPPHDGGRRPGGRRAMTSFAAAGAGAAAALVIAGVVLTTVQAAGTHPSPAGALTLPSSVEPASPAGPASTGPVTIADSPSDGPSATPSPTAPTTPASAGPSHVKPATSAPATPSPAPSSPAPTTEAVAPPPSQPTGLPLVNRVSGLCVGLTDRNPGSPLQLQQCTGQAAQRWERLTVGQDTYQLRNADTGMCLDGTTAGGNSVTVVMRSCRSGAQAAQQLWRFEPDAKTGAVRLWFVPPVPSSDYASHLFGPYNWPEADPPRIGSALVQEPDYYHSSSFLFTLG
ncbi:RICIN domain-containing protein [Kitasatospora sp. NPDC047058]|uniref:RICIN domain-containing protein n=1 Tax=Kitasatospora sp. NPDC047058 TaxID=3155620 RepID=UPI0033FBAA90